MSELQEIIAKNLLGIREIQVEDSEKGRINQQSSLIIGMIKTKSCHLSQISTGLNQEINAKSKETSASRFLENKWISAEEYYLPLLEAFLAVLSFMGSIKKFFFVVDGSQMGKHHACLMVSLVWQGRGIPICWMVKAGGKGHFSEDNHLSVLAKAKQIIDNFLPQAASITILGDGEFDGVNLQKFCLNQGWNYILRTRKDSVLHEEGERFSPQNVTVPPTMPFHFIPNVGFTEQLFSTNFLCWHDTKLHQDPIYLISNLSEAVDIAEGYNFRFSIECLFKDFKSNSFQLHKTRLKDAFSISNLIMIACCAFIFLALLALQFQQPEYQDITKKVMVVRKDKKTLSFFTFALRLFAYLTDRKIFPTFFSQFSNNFFNFNINSS